MCIATSSFLCGGEFVFVCGPVSTCLFVKGDVVDVSCEVLVFVVNLSDDFPAGAVVSNTTTTATVAAFAQLFPVVVVGGGGHLSTAGAVCVFPVYGPTHIFAEGRMLLSMVLQTKQ